MKRSQVSPLIGRWPITTADKYLRDCGIALLVLKPLASLQAIASLMNQLYRRMFAPSMCTETLPKHRFDRVSDRLTDHLTDRLTDRATDRVSERVTTVQHVDEMVIILVQ